MILITGATGVVGRQAVRLLVDGGQKVAAVSRTPESSALPDGVAVVRPEAIPAVLAGGEGDARVAAILVSPRAVGAGLPELLAPAAEHGVERVVLLSAVTVEHGGGEARFADGFRAAEKAVRDSGLTWTILRCATFAANSLTWVPQVRAGGVVRGAYGDAVTSPIHERDIAAVAVKALVEPGHAGRTYTLTGPEALSQRDQVRLVGEAIGAELSWQELAPEQVRTAMIAKGLPAEVPDRMLGYLADCAVRPGPTSNTVAELLDRPALTFAEWAADNARAFASVQEENGVASMHEETDRGAFTSPRRAAERASARGGDR